MRPAKWVFLALASVCTLAGCGRDAAGQSHVAWASEPSEPAVSAPTDSAPQADQTSEDLIDPRCLTGRTLCASKSARKLWFVVDGRIMASFDARFGGPGNETHEGVFKVERMSPRHVSSQYGDEMPYSMFFFHGEAVHYSADFADNGYQDGSHGCVNVLDLEGLAKVYAQVRIGDKVVVYR